MLYSNSKLRKKELFKPIIGVYISFRSGIAGFTLVFCLILVSKVLWVITEPAKSFNIDLNDIIISMWGFLIFSFVVFAVNNKNGNW